MAYIEPKTNWVASNIPVASDFNRIEGNTKQNHDDIAAEAIARAADFDAEEAERNAAISEAKSVLSVTSGDIAVITVPLESTSSTSFVVYKTYHVYASGSIRIKLTHRRGGNVSGSSVVRVLKNGAEQVSWTAQSSTNRVIDINISSGDIISIEQRSTQSDSTSIIETSSLSISSPLDLGLISNALFYSTL